MVAGDNVGDINCWDVVSMKEAGIPHWTFIDAFLDDKDDRECK